MQKYQKKHLSFKKRANASAYLIGLICGAYMLLVDKSISLVVAFIPCKSQTQQSSAEFMLVAIAAAITFILALRTLRKINKK